MYNLRYMKGRKKLTHCTKTNINRQKQQWLSITVEVLSGTYSENPLSISPLLPRKEKLMIAKELFHPTIDNNTTCKYYAFNLLYQYTLIKTVLAIDILQNPELLNWL
jgi:hypothetical protein